MLWFPVGLEHFQRLQRFDQQLNVLDSPHVCEVPIGSVCSAGAGRTRRTSLSASIACSHAFLSQFWDTGSPPIPRALEPRAIGGVAIASRPQVAAMAVGVTAVIMMIATTEIDVTDATFPSFVLVQVILQLLHASSR